MKNVKLEDLKEILREKEFTIFGHGTGSNNKAAIGSIFVQGLRASHTSMFYTTIGLYVDEDLNLFKEKLEHWEHLDSEYIILIKLPNKYFNIYGDSADLNCERTGAFVNRKIDNAGKTTYYLDPKFIIGAYNRNTSKVILNPNYEFVLTNETIKEMQEKLDKAIHNTKVKNKSFEENLLPQIINETNDELKFSLPELNMDSTLDDLNWENDFPPIEDEQTKTR